MINQAIILCAGLGTRLRPLTDTMPKPMILVGGKPLLEHLIVHLKNHGVRQFFINLHYLPDAIPAYFGDGEKWGITITYAYEPTLLGTAGGIKQFEPQLDDHFLVVYGDMWNEIDLQKLFSFYETKGRPTAVVAVARSVRRDADLVQLDENHRFQKLYHRPHPDNISTADTYLLNATYVFSKKLLPLIPAAQPVNLDLETLPKAFANDLPVYGYPTNELVIDVGTHERLEQIRKIIEK